MSRESAYRLRRRSGAGGFAAAWDSALNRPADPSDTRSSKVAELPPGYRFETGLIQVILYAGRYCGYIRKADDYGLIGHLSRHYRARRERRAGR